VRGQAARRFRHTTRRNSVPQRRLYGSEFCRRQVELGLAVRLQDELARCVKLPGYGQVPALRARWVWSVG
jgi:hypothetical protein